MNDTPLFFKLLFLKILILPDTPAHQFAHKVLEMESVDYPFPEYSEAESTHQDSAVQVIDENPAVQVIDEDPEVQVIEEDHDVAEADEIIDILEENTFLVDR